jgi:hypothetical protein
MRLLEGIFAVLICAGLFSACGGDDNGTETSSPTPLSTSSSLTATPTTAIRQGPVGLIAIGHSALTGYASDPDRPEQDAKQNSWATGTSSEVNSIYQRLAAALPQTEGHVGNFAKDGAEAATLAAQATNALTSVPQPALVIIQTIDNDIRCDGTDDQHVTAFGTAVGNALKVITDASPNSKILLVTQPGRPQRAIPSLLNNAQAKLHFEGSGICDWFSPPGDLVQEHVDTLTAIIESYEAEQARVCAAVSQCSTDNGAFADAEIDDISNFVTGDWNHFTVHGHALLAAAMWPTVAALFGLPPG